MLPVGQSGIRLREALVAGDVAAAVEVVPALDVPHRVELLLGAALRDARDGFAAARCYLEGDWAALCARLADPAPDLRYDHAAAAYVAAGQAPSEWRADGLPLGDRDVRSGLPDFRVAAALRAGVGGLTLVDTFADLPLHPAVSHYYRIGSLHALGCRPLLILAMTAGPFQG